MAFLQPEAGLVISYSYLWSDEAEAGHVEGRKHRPCAIVLVVHQPEGKAPVVTVAPITHSPHRNSDAAIEIPPAVKRHLGLDDEPSWIVLDDFNVFTWPGFDLRSVPGQKDRYHYGFLPPKLFRSIIAKFAELRRQGKALPTSRDDEAMR
ncbi:MAG: type II toxin-antitoxin system PemK/MazF family toxin [Steroidobacteraceae bacterium]